MANEVNSVNDEVVEDVEMYVNDNAKDEDEGNDDVMDDVIFLLEDRDVETDVEFVDGNVDVSEEVVEYKVSKNQGDVVSLNNLEEEEEEDDDDDDDVRVDGALT